MLNNNWMNKIRNSKNYKRWVGKCNDFTGAVQFQLLTMLGLKEHHKLLDIGCGSLRAGKLFIPYLLPGNYYGIEKEKWLIDEAVKNEIGQEQIELKQPCFLIREDFNLLLINTVFDFILCNSVFIHICLNDIEKIISQIRQSLNKKGMFVFNYIEGNTDNLLNKTMYPGYVVYTRKTIVHLLNKYGLKYEFLDWWYPGKQKWVGVYI